LQIADIPVPVEAGACAATSSGTIYFGGNDGAIYTLDGNSVQAAQSVQKTPITVYDEIAGLAVYEARGSNYLFVSVQPGTVEVYATSNSTNLWSISFSENDVELEGIAIYQKPLAGYQDGAFLLSFDEDPGPKGTGIFSLSSLGLPANKAFDPRASSRNPRPSLLCLNNGFQASASLTSPCICFSGFSGPRCAQRTCINNCSSRGTCTGPNTCRCNAGWTGPDCSFKTISATYETSANGGDGDDPAIWIHPTDKTKSRILTTTKSEEGAGFALFDLQGQILSQLPAGEPNNVDIIYGFTRDDGRVVDLAAAGCRDKDTIW
jgi:3-phytase